MTCAVRGSRDATPGYHLAAAQQLPPHVHELRHAAAVADELQTLRRQQRRRLGNVQPHLQVGSTGCLQIRRDLNAVLEIQQGSEKGVLKKEEAGRRTPRASRCCASVPA
jgi:hypothetical protein